MPWSASVVPGKVQRNNGSMSVEVELTDGQKTIRRTFDTQSETPRSDLKAKVAAVLRRLDALDAYTPADGPFDPTPDPPPAPTPPDTARNQYRADLGLYYSMEEAVRIGIFPPTHPQFLAQRQKLINDFQARFIDLLSPR